MLRPKHRKRRSKKKSDVTGRKRGTKAQEPNDPEQAEDQKRAGLKEQDGVKKKPDKKRPEKKWAEPGSRAAEE